MSFPVLAQTLPGTLLVDQLIPDLSNGGFHPHLTDLYIPLDTSGQSMALSAFVALHGGSGTKANFARNLGISTKIPATAVSVNWSILSAWRVMMVFPQGQHCSGIVGPFNPQGANTENSQNGFAGVATWSNHAMWSQANDVSFLEDLAQYLLSVYGLVSNIGGHSNGGMMVQRMWRESPFFYRHYCSSSGPASTHYTDNPVTPPDLRPLFLQYGQLDDVLDIVDGPDGPGDHFYDATWIKNPAQYSVADVAYPGQTRWRGGWEDFAAQAVMFGDSVQPQDGITTPVAIGQQTRWEAAGGALVMELYSAAGHEATYAPPPDYGHAQVTQERKLRRWLEFILQQD